MVFADERRSAWRGASRCRVGERARFLQDCENRESSAVGSLSDLGCSGAGIRAVGSATRASVQAPPVGGSETGLWCPLALFTAWCLAPESQLDQDGPIRRIPPCARHVVPRETCLRLTCANETRVRRDQRAVLDRVSRETRRGPALQPLVQRVGASSRAADDRSWLRRRTLARVNMPVKQLMCHGRLLRACTHGLLVAVNTLRYQHSHLPAHAMHRRDSTAPEHLPGASQRVASAVRDGVSGPRDAPHPQPAHDDESRPRGQPNRPSMSV